MPAGVSSALADLARAFAKLRVRWYVFGAQAVVAAGVPRLTADIDVTVEVPAGGSRALLAALARHGVEPRDIGEDLDEFVAETRVIPAVHAASGLPVDIVLAGPGLEEEMLARARARTVGRRKIPFIDVADLLCLKVLAGREKDLAAVRARLRAAPADLDPRVARERLARLAALLEDDALLAAFDGLAREVARARGPKSPRRRPRSE
mgnify:CR=1 FL=1